MPVHPNDPINLGGDISHNSAQDVRNLGNFTLAIFCQNRRTGRKQHLGREHKPVPLDAHAFLIAQNFTQPAKELRPVLRQILGLRFQFLGLFGQHLGLFLQPPPLRRFQLRASALLCGDPRQGGVQIRSQRLQLHGLGRVPCHGIIQQRLQIAQLRAQGRDLLVQQFRLPLRLCTCRLFL